MARMSAPARTRRSWTSPGRTASGSRRFVSSTVGACRLCIVEVKGTNKLLPACATRVSEGMEVTAHSDRLHEYRKMIVELLFAEGNHICSVCVANGHCDLQALAQQLGMDHVRMPYLHPRRPVDASHER